MAALFRLCSFYLWICDAEETKRNFEIQETEKIIINSKDKKSNLFVFGIF